jgi:hypothetical protein
MPISHIGQTTIHTRDRGLILKNVLHVPTPSKVLLSVQNFTYDNNAFFEFHPWYFLLKDQDTRKLLLQERCNNGLYPLPLAAWSSQSLNKAILAAIKPNLVRWHHQLGHASSPIIERVVSQNKLSFSKENLNVSICYACQRKKSHQLSFPKSVSVSQAPLELVFLDVWGPAPSSVGHFKYYV